MFKQFLSHVQLNGYVLALIGTVAAAPFLGCRGTSPEIFHALGSLAIASLFFLQGARLSRAALVAGAEHWRLHAAIAFATFVLFSIVWVGVMGGSAARAPAVAVVGSVVCLRSPSTLQSSIALTSISRGNVAGAVCSAAGSNLASLFLTPILFGLVSGVHKSAISLAGSQQIVL